LKKIQVQKKLKKNLLIKKAMLKETNSKQIFTTNVVLLKEKSKPACVYYFHFIFQKYHKRISFALSICIVFLRHEKTVRKISNLKKMVE